MVKSSFGKAPAKGTKSRYALIMMLRGAKSSDIRDQYSLGPTELFSIVSRLRNDCGYDIRAFPPKRKGSHGSPPSIYKCVGKMKWDGSYRSFIDDDVQAYLAERN